MNKLNEVVPVSCRLEGRTQNRFIGDKRTIVLLVVNDLCKQRAKKTISTQFFQVASRSSYLILRLR